MYYNWNIWSKVSINNEYVYTEELLTNLSRKQFCVIADDTSLSLLELLRII